MSRPANSQIELIGAEQRPVIIVDDLISNPAALRDEASDAAFQPEVRFFPGVQAPFSFERMNELISPFIPTISRTFKTPRALSVIECGFAMVTTPPEKLMPLQRIPHIDTTDSFRLAVLVYISGEEFGGTAFYRHKATGFEYLDESRNVTYNEALDRDVETHGVPGANYISSHTEIFEQIARFDAKPGRAIIYPSNSLHSGCIQNETRLSDDVHRGRLTLNAFLAPQ